MKDDSGSIPLVHVMKYSCGTAASFVKGHMCVVKMCVTKGAPLQELLREQGLVCERKLNVQFCRVCV